MSNFQDPIQQLADPIQSVSTRPVTNRQFQDRKWKLFNWPHKWTAVDNKTLNEHKQPDKSATKTNNKHCVLMCREV